MHTTQWVCLFLALSTFFSLIRFKFHSYLFDLHTYIKQHTKSFLCFVHHVKELFLRFFDPAPYSSFKRALSLINAFWASCEICGE